MKFFLSCDWGTSTFRLRLIDAATKTVLSQIKTDNGIANIFACWKQTNQHENNRLSFYKKYLFEQVEKIAATFPQSLDHTPIMISGMASSSIGMIEVPYKELPFNCDGSDLITHTIKAEKENELYDIIMISGVRSQTDVMRGEETILAGCSISTTDTQQYFILPGTHSKHILVNNGIAQNISTYITGELFDLLSNKSILSASVKKNDLEDPNVDLFFVDGVIEGASSNILNSIFRVRINHLFTKATAQQNYQYLSGLLIGHELKETTKNKPSLITLVCGETLKKYYLQALTVLGLNDNLDCKNADEALINGQWKVMQQAGYFL